MNASQCRHVLRVTLPLRSVFLWPTTMAPCLKFTTLRPLVRSEQCYTSIRVSLGVSCIPLRGALCSPCFLGRIGSCNLGLLCLCTGDLFLFLFPLRLLFCFPFRFLRFGLRLSPCVSSLAPLLRLTCLLFFLLYPLDTRIQAKGKINEAAQSRGVFLLAACTF